MLLLDGLAEVVRGRMLPSQGTLPAPADSRVNVVQGFALQDHEAGDNGEDGAVNLGAAKVYTTAKPINH